MDKKDSTGAAGLEPAAGDLEGRYSIHLSYAPKAKNFSVPKVTLHCIHRSAEEASLLGGSYPQQCGAREIGIGVH